MATITTLQQSGASYIANVQLDAGDLTSGNIPHGLGVDPVEADICALLFGAVLVNPSVTTIDATNIVITKESNAANTEVLVRLMVKRPHSIDA